MSIFDVQIPSWTKDAACLSLDPSTFFPPEGSRGYARAALKICADCPVATQCLAYALDYEAEHPGSRWGVYGGTTPRMRRTMTTKKRAS